MGVGVGVLLLVAGAILYWAVDADIPWVSDDTLGIIVMVAGVLAIILALIQTQLLQRSRRTTVVHGDRRDPPGP